MDELLKFLSDKGTEISPNAMIYIAFLYFIVWKDLRGRLAGLSAYFKRFLVIQRDGNKAARELAGSLRALCRQITEKEDCSECSQCREERQ